MIYGAHSLLSTRQYCLPLPEMPKVYGLQKGFYEGLGFKGSLKGSLAS